MSTLPQKLAPCTDGVHGRNLCVTNWEPMFEKLRKLLAVFWNPDQRHESEPETFERGFECFRNCSEFCCLRNVELG